MRPAHYPDGDTLPLATAYYHEHGEDLTQDEVIARLAEELYIKEPLRQGHLSGLLPPLRTGRIPEYLFHRGRF